MIVINNCLSNISTDISKNNVTNAELYSNILNLYMQLMGLLVAIAFMHPYPSNVCPVCS